MKKCILFLQILILLASFSFTQESVSKVEASKYLPEKNPMLFAVLWQQRSAEYRALCYQAFNIARYMVDQEIKNKIKMKKAIVLDLDETVIDNSPFQANGILNNTNFPVGWNEWVNKACAQALPGAVEFLNYADSKGFDIFYVSNRGTNQLEATMKNLKVLGFPQVDSTHFCLREKGSSSSKEDRRVKISKTHYIALLLGDNLNDFSDVFEKKLVNERFNETDKYRYEFGKRFIVLPNPMYGDWESAIYEYKSNLSQEEKNKMLINNLVPDCSK